MRKIILSLFITCISFSLLASPASITGPGWLCTGLTIGLLDATPGGTWSSSNPAVASVTASPTLDTGLVTGISAGTAIITYTVGSGTVTTVITVNQTPAAIIPTAISCAGTSTTFSDATPGGTWGSSNLSVATIGSSTGIVLSVATGWSEISYTFGACAVVTYIEVPPYCPCSGTPIPGIATTNNASVCPGDSAILDLSGDSIAYSLTYQWQSAPDAATWTNIPGATTVPYTYYPPSALYYRAIITCTLNALSAYSGSVLVAMNSGSIIAAHTVVNSPSYSCNSLDFYLEVCGYSSAYNVTTYFGDGTSSNNTFNPSYAGNSYVDIYHTYAFPGTYFVKQVFYNGSTPLDSVSFPYEYLYCNILPIKFYLDANNNCIKDTNENYIYTPLTVEVDSNSVPIDTIKATSGVYYPATGSPGTIYAFRVLPGSLFVSCPSSGILYDTIQSYVNNYPVKYIALNCSSTTSFDLQVNAEVPIPGVHDQIGYVYVSNNYCVPTNATLTMHYSPKFVAVPYWTIPTPSSISGNTITWNFTGLSAATGTLQLRYGISANPDSASLSAGDTVHSDYTITPITGDVNPYNNYDVIVDTVRDGFDPNEMSVSPAGYIPSGTQLQYTINFMNVGNDTAFNIYAMDTLSDNVDPKTLQIVLASATMNIAILNYGGHNIVKFDFPNINLLDSSHHGQCNGTVIFNINVDNNLPEGTTIFNHAGVFFDYNPVVTTDTVENIIGWPAKVASVANDHKITISPNPTTNELTITMSQNAYNSFTITNSIGQQILQQPLTQTQTTVNVSTLPPGLYIITFKGDNGTTVQKFVKE